MEGQEKGLARTPSRGTEDSSATVAGAGDVGGLQRIVSRARSGSPLPDESVEKKERMSDDDWEDDPANPRNWGSGKKWTAVGIVRLVRLLFIPPLTSSMMAPGMQEIALKYGITNSTVLALTLSIFLLALAIGPLVLGPLSEIYGRTWVLHIANLVSLAFNLGCAFAPATGSFIGLRFLSGLAGSAPIAIGGGSISDLFSDRDRGGAMGAFSMGPLIGPVVGPIAGGFIAQTVGVKWVFIVIACLNGVAAAVGIPLLRETYHPILRKRIAKRNGDVERLRVDPVVEEAGMSKVEIIWVNIQRPIMLLFGDVICFLLSLYMALIFYLMFATFSAFFSKTYGFKAGVGGLVYIGIGIGSLVAVIIGAKVGDRIYWGLSAKYNNGVGKPEYRVPSLILGSMVIPIGLFWYGWSAEAATHWIVPILGTAVYAFGQMMTFLPIQLYLVDTFTYAASAVAAATFFRSMFGFAFPLFAQEMFDTLGMGGGLSLLAGLSIVLGIPFPIFLWFKGESIRAKSRFAKASVKA
ncbi:MFS general substrate transporter [Schizophyllum commune Tattone D]|nr:MFS general substrate transporter [Schizophyllum commune Tattone D]